MTAAAPDSNDSEDTSHLPADLPPRGPTLRRAGFIALGVLALLCTGAAITVGLRLAQAKALQSTAAEQSRIYVHTVHAQPRGAAASAASLTLPGSLQGKVESPIYARSAGYVRRWTHDLGSRVKQGELLAEIDTPEVDQQLSQTLAARRQAASSLELARSSAVRWEELRAKDAVSQQELDERKSAFLQAEANLAAADANVSRLRQTQGFNRVIAPFAGTVTQRNVDVGDLVDAAGGIRGRPLFALAQTDPLRVYVYVPQSYAQQVKVGQPVRISQAELPGVAFQGQVARTAGAIDAATRTLQTEIALPNPDGTLLPGAYVQVAMPVGGANAALAVPSNTLLLRAEGPRIAVVGADGKVALRPVTLGRDDGKSIEITEGITAADALVLNPPDSLRDHDQVTVVATPAAGAASAASAAGKAGA